MYDFRTIVKIENHSSIPYNVQHIFGTPDDKPTLYPCIGLEPRWRSSTLGSACFLRYRSVDSANCALNLAHDFKELRVLRVHQDMRLVNEYMLADPSTLYDVASPNACGDERPAISPEPGLIRESPGGRVALKHAGRNPLSTKHRNTTELQPGLASIGDKDKGDDDPGPEGNPTAGGFHTADSTTSASFSALALTAQRPSFTLIPGFQTPKRGPTIFGNTDTETLRLSGDFVSSGSHLLGSSSAGDAILPVTTFPVSYETQISVTICGDTVTYDLHKSNPRVIIELLKLTKSERTSYLAAAAFYRRSGNPQGAKTVLTSLMEELLVTGVTADKLKPIFLFMSGCELDLAKLAKADNKRSEFVTGHYTEAQNWLQKVFGKADPVRQTAEAKNRKGDNDALLKAIEQSSEAEKSSHQREVAILEREMRSLRDRNSDQASQISHLRSGKRKIEDDYFAERELRRKYQRELVAVEKERDAARRMENFALDRLKREVSERRKLG